MAQIAFDSFHRAAQSNWGTGDDGQAWTATGAAYTLSIATVSGTGEGKATGATSNGTSTYGSITPADCEVVVRLQGSSASDAIGVLLRFQNSTNYYRMRVNATSFALIKNVAGVTTTIATVAFTPTASTWYWIRARAVGTAFYGKVWADGSPEPATWSIITSDSQFASGNVGLFYTGNAVGDVMLFDSFAVADYATGDAAYSSIDFSVPIDTGGTAPSANPYGFTVFIGNANIIQRLPQIIADMKALGAAWLRLQIPWHLIDQVGDGTQKLSTYNLSGLDDAVFQCQVAGITLQFCIQMPPQGTGGGQGSVNYYTQAVVEAGGPPYAMLPSATYMAVFAQQLAARYNGVFNVPNYGPLFLPSLELGNEDFDLASNSTAVRDNGGKYLANCIVAAYPVIKAASPNCFVSCGASLRQDTATHVPTWFGGLFGNGAGPYLSNLNFHWYKNGGTYPVGKTPEDGTVGFTAMYQAIASFAASAGYGNLKIWVTECGYDAPNATNPPGSVATDAAHQWQYFQQELDTSRLSNAIDHVFWYTIGSDDTKSLTQGGQNDNFAPLKTLVNPAYSGLQTYIATYPSWSASTGAVTVLLPAISRRDGAVATGPARRDGRIVAGTKRRG